MASADPRLDLARKLWDRLGDRDKVLSAMTNLGYGKAESAAALDQAVPESKPKPKTRPKPKTSGATDTAGAGTDQGVSPSTPTPPVSPAPAASKGGTSGLSLPDMPRPTLSLPRRPTGRDVTGFGIGLFGFALALQWFRYGAGGPTAWFKAKFLNDTSAAAVLPPAAGDSQLGGGGTTTRPGAGDFTTRPSAPPPPTNNTEGTPT